MSIDINMKNIKTLLDEYKRNAVTITKLTARNKVINEALAPLKKLGFKVEVQKSVEGHVSKPKRSIQYKGLGKRIQTLMLDEKPRTPRAIATELLPTMKDVGEATVFLFSVKKAAYILMRKALLSRNVNGVYSYHAPNTETAASIGDDTRVKQVRAKASYPKELYDTEALNAETKTA